ncbi:DUF6498-containing protein [Botrimarina sp.]|uniref:DUF6498-containing protein n=1 Tax=Botrimarina sp. TaxID=2795802 RepID=UPI0032ED94A4
MHPLQLPTAAQLENHRWSVVSLVAANVIPLAGVLLLGWRVFDVVFVYWLENVVIGAINVLKILTCSPDPGLVAQRYAERLASLPPEQREQLEKLTAGGAAWNASKLFFAPFFTVHYGLFCFVHGVFVGVLAGEGGPLGGSMNPFGTAIEALQSPALLVAAIGLAASHLVSYFTNYLGRGEYRRLTPPELMIAPYGRVVVLHVAIVLSGFFVMTLGSPVWLLLLLVIGKTLFDLTLHLREHERGAGSKALGAS